DRVGEVRDRSLVVAVEVVAELAALAGAVTSRGGRRLGHDDREPHDRGQHRGQCEKRNARPYHSTFPSSLLNCFEKVKIRTVPQRPRKPCTEMCSRAAVDLSGCVSIRPRALPSPCRGRTSVRAAEYRAP